MAQVAVGAVHPVKGALCCPLCVVCGDEENTAAFVCCPLVAFGLFQTL